MNFNIHSNTFQKYSESQNKFEEKKKIVNDSIRICIECGNISVKIENFGIYCKQCGNRFKIKKDL